MEIQSLMAIRQAPQKKFLHKLKHFGELLKKEHCGRRARQCDVWGGSVLGTLPSSQHQYRHRDSGNHRGGQNATIRSEPPMHNQHTSHRYG